MYKLIKTINVDRANFEHIATTGNINGTLLIELVRVMKEYHLQQLALTEVVQAKPEVCAHGTYQFKIINGSKFRICSHCHEPF